MGILGLDQVELDAAELALDAGRILFKYFAHPGDPINNLGVDYKNAAKTDPVTIADTEIQDYLTAEISKRHPSHGIVGEEGAANGGVAPDMVWVLDPLDGTRNFLHGLPAFACSIGVLHQGSIVAGAVFIPWPGMDTGIVLHASRGSGAKIDGKTFTTPVMKAADPAGIMTLPGSFSSMFKFEDGFASRSGELRMAGSIAYELSLVALGITQYAVISGAHLWDIAGGLAVVMESGGGARKRVKLPIGDRLIGSTSPWGQIGALVNSSESGDFKYEEFRKYTPPILVASNSIIGELSANTRPKDMGIKGVTGSIFR